MFLRHLLSGIVCRIHPYERAKYYRIYTIILNPILTSLCILLIKLFIYDPILSKLQIQQQQISNRESYIDLQKLLFYQLFGRLALYFNSYLSLFEMIVLTLLVPNSWTLIWILYAFYNVASAHNLITYFKELFFSLDEFNAAMDEARRVNYPPSSSSSSTNSLNSTIISPMLKGPLSSMNLQQLLLFQKDLNSEIEKRRETQSHEATQIDELDLISKICVVCRSKPPCYRFKPCYHTCVCEDCVLSYCEIQHDDNDYTEEEGDEDGSFFQNLVFKAKSFATDMCPICRMPITGVEYYKHFIPHQKISSEEFHMNGRMRGYNETLKLIQHIRENPTLKDRLIHCTQYFKLFE
ncbi:hypothetical protein C9374_003040 [Naegleria lovaniensis]|uniref:RING-type domain-containing protein n=1 Tax=Naegleria lovaniensis TaxID=51637 RepID=A0AA88GPF2_NAELO|nr:uncharacterized protein C9374_003040 [Naegleria lovaniensis]KAG2385891.1 hypothetical protein C9374_003040 [Naegleria lovaniensis]